MINRFFSSRFNGDKSSQNKAFLWKFKQTIFDGLCKITIFLYNFNGKVPISTQMKTNN